MKRGNPLKRTGFKKKKTRRPKDIADWNITQLRKEADAQWNIAVKERDKWTCQYCGCTDKQMNAHHLRGRGALQYRHELDNGICLCVRHHLGGKGDTFSAEGTPLKFMRWLECDEKSLDRWKFIDDLNESERSEREQAREEGRAIKYRANPTADELRETIKLLKAYIEQEKDNA